MIPVFIVLIPTAAGPTSATTHTLSPPTLRLLRRIRYSNQTQVTDTTDAIESAVWWPAFDNEGSGHGGERRMYGEIALKKDLKPNTQMAHFSIEVGCFLDPLVLIHS